MRILCLRFLPPPPNEPNRTPSRREPSRRDRHRPDAELREVDPVLTVAELEEFSPTVGRHERHDRRCFCLDVTGTGRWFGGEKALVARLRAWCAERRRAARVAIADSLGAAWA